MKVMTLILITTITITPTLLPTEVNANDIYNYLWANYAQFNGELETAGTWYKKIVDQDPQQPCFYYKGYLPYLLEKNNIQAILDLVPVLDKQFENDVDIQIIFAQALLKAHKEDEAQARFIMLNNKFKTNQAIAFQAANIYMQKKEPENAIAVIDGVLNAQKKPNNFIFHFLKAQLYVQLNDKPKALESVKMCLQMQPHFDKGWLMLALLEEQLGHLQEAIQGYTNFLEASGGNQEIQQHLLQLVFKQKMMKDNQSNIVIAQPCFLKAMKLFEQKQYKAALAQIEECIRENPKDSENKLLKIQILSAMDNYTQAAQQLKNWIISEPTNELWFKTLYLLSRSGLPTHKAIAIFEDCAQAHPTNLLPILYLADLNTRVKQHETALKYHTQALGMTTDLRLKTKIHYHIALIYHQQKKFAAMEKTLEEGHALGLNFPPLLNLLAHHYAQSNKNLEKAEALLQIALQNNKNNPHFLDTQALLLYRKKEYAQALTLLLSIAQQEPNDFGILSTLGKTHYEVGNFAQAVQTIEQAMTVATHDQDKEQCNLLLKEWNNLSHE